MWQQFTLRTIPMEDWRSASWVGKLVGLFQGWRRGSVIWPWAGAISTLLMALVLILAPFVPTTMIGMLLVACAGFWLLWTLVEPSQGRLSGVHLLITVFWGIALLATGLSPVKSAALMGLAKLSLYLAFFALAERTLRSPQRRSQVITVYLLVALAVSVEAMRQWFFGAEPLATWTDPESSLANVTRVYSFLGNPNLLAGYLLPAIPLSGAAILAWRGWLPKLLAVVMLLLNGSSLVLTFSRGGWLGLVATLLTMALLLLVWLLPRLPRFWQRWGIPLLFSGLALFLVAAILGVPALRDRVASIFVARGDSSNNFRINVWTAVQAMIRDRPWLGIGPGNDAFNRVYPLFQTSARFTALSAYSIFLELLVEVGVIGFSVFLWFLVVLGDRGWRGLIILRDRGSRELFWLIAALATVAGMLTHGLVDTIWYRPEVATLWWLMVAIIVSSTEMISAREALAPSSAKD